MTTLAIAEATVSYARRQVSNGLSPLEARQALIETAAELGAVAASLQRLARLRPAERRAMVTMLTNMGMRGPEIAARLGLSQRSVYRYRAASRAR